MSSQIRYLPKLWSHQTHGTFPVLSPKKLSLVSRVCRQMTYLPPIYCWGCSSIGVCGYLLLSPGQAPFWSGASTCWGCLNTARLVVPLWKDMGMLEGVGLQANAEVECLVPKRFKLAHCGRGHAATWKNLGKARMEGVGLQKRMGVRHPLSTLRGECCGCNGSCMCPCI